ncbi:2-dehydropantoate 2-reductase [Dyella japonica]|uniref:2-dehydropantoate 2-reductase n=1 Tax=Dyella japonica DSM 16301 TaxID=1440762 RepID=A0A0G9H0N6_9GAMM|nr:2-dehydropantoate 2-reductase [Dyella japonica]KLD62749.1 2-dehydropantoate 2-reductase [Dyella japonica DSM 16301]
MSVHALPRIAIYGAGSVGGYLGARLHDNARITCIGRRRVIDAWRIHGLDWSDLLGGHEHIAAREVELQVNPFAAAKAHLVLVTVKSSATETVARELAGVIAPGVPVVSFQNGLHNAAILRDALPGHPVLAGMVPFNVLQRVPGDFHQGSGGELMVEAHESLAAFLPVFEASGLPLMARNDMPAVLSAKLLLNLNNALNALSNLPLKEQLSQRDWRRCLALAQREALAVFDAAGMHPAKLTPLPPAWLPRVLEMPDSWFRRLASRLLAIDPVARSSMWEDLERGRSTEVEAINGEVVRLAAAHQVAAPVNARLVELVHQVEQARRTWTAQELLDDLRSRAAT